MTESPAPHPANSPAAAKRGGHRWLILAGCCALLVALGWVDYITGYELGFFVFYSLPVGLAAWYLGRWPAVAVALAASATWWLADFYSGMKYSSRFYYYWNGTIHFLAFLINAVTIAKIKNDLDRRHQLAAELEAARQSLRAMARMLPACPHCGRPREHTGSSREAEGQTFVAEHPELEEALCADCRSGPAGQPRDSRLEQSSP